MSWDDELEFLRRGQRPRLSDHLAVRSMPEREREDYAGYNEGGTCDF